MQGYLTLIPYGVLLFGVAWALFADLLPGRDKGAALVGSFSAFIAAVLFALIKNGTLLFGEKLLVTSEARFAALAVCVLTGIWLLWVYGRSETRIREAVALSLFTAMGASLMVAAYDLLVMILAIELATMPAYVLIGYKRSSFKSLEGAIKYFLLSVLASMIMIYGVTFLIGVTGSTGFSQLDVSGAGLLGSVAVMLVFVGIFAKVSAAPMHYWAPDAYEAAPAWIVAFVASVPKVAGFVLAGRLVLIITNAGQATAVTSSLGTVLTIVAVASMGLGALAALTQKNIKRLMAYSGVVNAGYMFIALVAITPMGFYSVAAFAFYYALATMGVLLIAASEGDNVSDLAGLSTRRPFAAWALVIFVLSLIGVPPLAGFFGKFLLFTSAFAAGQSVLVILATVASVLSAFYYLRLIKAAFFDKEEATEELGEELEDAEKVCDREQRSPFLGGFAIAIITLLVALLGAGSGNILEWMANPPF